MLIDHVGIIIAITITIITNPYYLHVVDGHGMVLWRTGLEGCCSFKTMLILQALRCGNGRCLTLLVGVGQRNFLFYINNMSGKDMYQIKIAQFCNTVLAQLYIVAIHLALWLPFALNEFRCCVLSLYFKRSMKIMTMKKGLNNAK